MSLLHLFTGQKLRDWDTQRSQRDELNQLFYFQLRGSLSRATAESLRSCTGKFQTSVSVYDFVVDLDTDFEGNDIFVIENLQPRIWDVS